jgi:thymidylate kinase
MIKGIIILDGPDACGKTTLAKAIEERCKQLGASYSYIHSEYRFTGNMVTYHEAVVRKAIKLSQSSVVVIDRLYWSEYVYANVFRNGSRWPHQHRYFDRLLLRFCALNVLCGSSPTQVVQWHQAAKDERAELYQSGLDKVAQEYINIYKRFKHRRDYTWYDRNTCPDAYARICYADGLLARIQSLRDTQESFALDPSCYNMLGHIGQANYLFVGEALKNPSNHSIWPYWSYRTYSLHLTKTLDVMGFDESKAVWANHNECGDTIPLIMESKPSLNIIAIGVKAGKKMKNDGYGIIKTIPSPTLGFSIPAYAKQVEEALNVLWC